MTTKIHEDEIIIGNITDAINWLYRQGIEVTTYDDLIDATSTSGITVSTRYYVMHFNEFADTALKRLKANDSKFKDFKLLEDE